VFPKSGVKLAFLPDFYEACGRRDKLEGLTTTEGSQQFIQPLAAQTKSSFCDLLVLSGHPAVGEAEIFISHAWRYKFLAW
jgi:hypothetical protein